MKKRIILTILIGFLLNICLVYGDETTQTLGFDGDKIVELSKGWTYVEDFWIDPENIDFDDTKSRVDLNEIIQVKDEDRIRGTIYISFEVPQAKVNTPFVINNTLFNDALTVFINGKAYEKSKLMLNFGTVEDGYIFVPGESQVKVVIHFDQALDAIQNKSGLFVGSLSTFENNQRFIWILESFMVALTLVFLIYLFWQRFANRVKANSFLLELLVIAFLVRFIMPEVSVMNFKSDLGYVRLQFFIFTFITTVFVTRGFKGKDFVVPYILELSKVYLLLYAAVVVVTPLNYLNVVGLVHMILIFAYMIWCNIHKLQKLATFIFAYYLMISTLNWYNVIHSSFYMLPVMVVLIYVSFNREKIGVLKPSEEEVEPVKETYTTDKSDTQCRELLMAMEEGIILLTSDLYIDHAYSEVTQAYFGFDIRHKKITDILYQDDFDNKVYAETILGRFFEAETENDKKLYLDLLSNKITLNERVVDVKYKMTKDEQYIAVIFKDQTAFQEQFDEKESLQTKLEMILEIIKNQSEFKQLYQMFLNFNKHELDGLAEKSNSINQYLDLLIEQFDYFEKQFDFFRLTKATDKINKITNELVNLRKEGSFSSYVDVQRYLEIFEMETLLSDDLELLEGALNENVMKHENLMLVDQSDFSELERRLSEFPGTESLFQLLSKMKLAQNQKVIRQYDQYISELARRYGKKVKPIKIDGYEHVVNNQQFSNILKGMMNLIDNAIIHGIETPSERFRKNKSEFGNLEVTIKRETSYTEMIFTDDGQGVDYNRIKDMLYQQQRVPFETLVLLNAESLSDYLLEEGVTADAEHHKGMGLSQLKREIDLQKGSIKVESALNRYTRVIIRIPESTHI